MSTKSPLPGDAREEEKIYSTVCANTRDVCKSRRDTLCIVYTRVHIIHRIYNKHRRPWKRPPDVNSSIIPILSSPPPPPQLNDVVSHRKRFYDHNITIIIIMFVQCNRGSDVLHGQQIVQFPRFARRAHLIVYNPAVRAVLIAIRSAIFSHVLPPGV